MYAQYKIDLVRTPISVQISAKLHPEAARLDLRTLREATRYDKTEQSVLHQSVGKLAGVRSGRAVFAARVPRVEGRAVGAADRHRRASPARDRRAKLATRRLREDCLELLNPAASLPRAALNPYPPWENMLKGIERFAPELMLVQNDEIALKLSRELEELFLVWNSEPNLNFRSHIDRHLVHSRHIYFDKRPFWASDSHDRTASQQRVANTLLVHRAIAVHFWSSVVPRLAHPWSQLLQGQMTYSDLETHINNYLKAANKVTKFDWSLEICEILLAMTPCWIHHLSEPPQRDQFFNSIASLQSKLLTDVVHGNIQQIMDDLMQHKQGCPFYIMVELAEERTPADYSASGLAGRLAQVGEAVLRVECRLYPALYPHERTFSIGPPATRDRDRRQRLEPFGPVLGEQGRLAAALHAIPAVRGETDLRNVTEAYGQLNELENRTRRIRTRWHREPYEFDFSHVKESILSALAEYRATILGMVSDYLYDLMKDVVDFATRSSQKLYGQDQMVQMNMLVEVRDDDYPNLKTKLDHLHNCFQILGTKMNFSEIMLKKYYTASRTAFRLSYLVNLIWQKLMVDKNKIEKALTDKTNAVHYDLMLLEENLRLCAKRYRVCRGAADLRALAARFAEVDGRVGRLAAQLPVLQRQLALFELEPLKEGLGSLAERARLLRLVSDVHLAVGMFAEEFEGTRVVDVHVQAANQTITDLNQKFETLKENIGEPEEEIQASLQLFLYQIEKVLDQFNQVLPVLNVLRSAGIKARHWEKILGDAGLKEGQNHVELTVRQLLKVDLREGHPQNYEEISELAAKEMVLEEGLARMQEQLGQVPLDHTRNQLSGVFEMQVRPEHVSLIDELLIRTQMSVASQSVTALLPQLKAWLERLQRLQTAVHLHQQCMAKWTYLEPLFAAEDIAYQMPEEWRHFQQIRDSWRDLTEKLSSITKLIDLSDVDHSEDMRKLLDLFQVIQRGFDVYLQKRKFNYPRLHFLSNNELLEMLSRARQPDRIQPYLLKLFPAAHGLELRQQAEIVAVRSEQGERLPLLQPVNIHHFKRHADKWLAELERQVRAAVRANLRALGAVCGQLQLPTLADYTSHFTAQSVLLHCRLVCARRIEEAIVSGTLTELSTELEQHVQRLLRSEPETPVEKQLLENLIVEVSQQRNLVHTLIQHRCRSVHSFEWTSQIRYYWADDDLYVRVYNLNIRYGYEYLAVQSTFVSTPTIQRVHRELLTFQAQGYAGMLHGPAATGKSESIKELAHLLGNFIVVFNCSPHVDRRQLEDLICGTILSGSTLCLDEFNRLSERDMAWFASHLMGIYQAIHSTDGSARYRLRGAQLSVAPRAAFYCTINPARCAARSRLPAGLRAAVRAIGVPAADLRAIAAALLQLAGVRRADAATHLLCAAFERCGALLPAAAHHHFQLRTALAAVREALRLLRRRDGDAARPAEAETVGRALLHVLRPHLRDADLRTFHAIARALHIDRIGDTPAAAAAKALIREECARGALAATDQFVECCHSVGRSFATSPRPAAAPVPRAAGLPAAGRVAERQERGAAPGPPRAAGGRGRGVPDGAREPVAERRRLPLRPLRREPPGLAARPAGGEAERAAGARRGGLAGAGRRPRLGVGRVAEPALRHRPQGECRVGGADLQLCLANGENVVLSPQIRVIFECDSLKKVAPSTISRCQVIYFDENVVPESVWVDQVNKSNPELASAISHLSLNRVLNRKILNERAVHLLKLFSKVSSGSEPWPFLAMAVGRTVKEEEAVDKWMEGLGLDPVEVMARVPLGIGQWKTLNTEDPEEVKEQSKIELIKQLVTYGKYLVTIYGPLGSGKMKFLDKVVQKFESSRWEVHLLNMSADLTANDLFNAIMGCNLIKLASNHYTTAGEKSVLIVLQGVDRLRITSNDSCLELLRSYFDHGRMLSPQRESVKFSAVFFLADYATEVVGPQNLTLPERLRRHVFPVYSGLTEERYPNEICDRFLALYQSANTEENLFYNCLLNEIQASHSELPRGVYALCHKTTTHLEQRREEYDAMLGKLEGNREKSRRSTSCVALQLPDMEPDVYQFGSLEAQLLEVLERRKVNKHRTLNSYLLRQFSLLYKVFGLEMDGHCVMVGEPENNAAAVIELAADVMEVHLEAPPSQMTDTYWKETVMKVTHMCTRENRSVILHVTDDIPHFYPFGQVLSDLGVLLHHGGLPHRLFQQPARDESGGVAISAFPSRYAERRDMAAQLRRHLHVVVTANRRTVLEHRDAFFDLFHHCVAANLDNWEESDMRSFACTHLAALRESGAELRTAVRDVMAVHRVMTGINPKFNHSDFISFVQTYHHMVVKKRDKLTGLLKRYNTGIENLNRADEQMKDMQEELVRLQPKLVRTSLETSMLISQIERETIEIENTREIVAANELKANEAATKAQALKVECERDLAEALPALDASVVALECLSQRDISILKTLRKPPHAVRMCMEAVCLLLGEQPVKIKDDKRIRHDYWPTALKCLSDIQFLRRIRHIDKDKIPDATMETLRRKFLNRPEFDPDVIKETSLAAEGLCRWVRAIDTYDSISKTVEPKKQRLRNAELMVKSNMKALDARRRALAEVTERLQRLSDAFSQQSQRKLELQNQIQACEQRVHRSAHLLNALGGERTRWEANIAQLEQETAYYQLTIMLAAAVITYMGNMEDAARKKAIALTSSTINYTKAFSIRSVLDHTSVLFDEKKEKLVENYTIAEYSRKVAFIIDPHGESQRMLPRLFNDKLQVVDLHKMDYMVGVLKAVKDGKTLVVDNLVCPAPLFVWQLMNPKVVHDENKNYIQLENHLCEISDDFRLFLRSDHLDKFPVDFMKRVSCKIETRYTGIKVCVVNISLGPNGIQDNVTDLFLSVNMSQLIERRDALSDERTRCLLQLDQLEEKIMDVLGGRGVGKAKDLDNDRVMDMIGGVADLSRTYDARTAELNQLESRLDEMGRKYQDLSRFMARLIFVSMNLAKLSPFYLRTLRFYFDIFREAVSTDPKAIQDGKVAVLQQKLLDAFHAKIVNSLFAEHRPVFQFLTKHDYSYEQLKRLPDKDFITQFSKFTQPVDINLKDIVFQHDSSTPIALLLSASSTYVIRNIYTMAKMMERAEPRNALDPNHNPSRIQLVPAESLKDFDWRFALNDDQWLLVQNCQHLDGDQISAVEALIERVGKATERKETFRMFLVVYPATGEAHHSLLGRCRVVTVDDDFSLRGWLVYCYTTISPSWLHDTLESVQRRELLYRMCCFHRALVERCKYGFFGWISEFSVSTVNFESAVSLFKDLCERWAEISFSQLCSNVLEIAYLADIQEAHDVLVFKTIAQWIFVGLNKHDNANIDALKLHQLNQPTEKLLREIKKSTFPKDTVICGLSDKIVKWTKRRNILDVKKEMLSMLVEDMQTAEMDDEDEDTEENADGSFSVTADVKDDEEDWMMNIPYLKHLLDANDLIRRLEIRHFQRPQAILEQLRQNFTKQHKLQLDDVIVYGTTRQPLSNTEFVEFAGCFITGAGFDKDYGCIQEPTKPIQPVETVYVTAKRRNLPMKPDTMLIPLFHKHNTKGFDYLLEVEMDSNIPHTHWVLRGVKLCTRPPIRVKREDID